MSFPQAYDPLKNPTPSSGRNPTYVANMFWAAFQYYNTTSHPGDWPQADQNYWMNTAFYDPAKNTLNSGDGWGPYWWDRIQNSPGGGVVQTGPATPTPTTGPYFGPNGPGGGGRSVSAALNVCELLDPSIIAALTTQLVGTKFAQTNNPAYLTIKGLVDAARYAAQCLNLAGIAIKQLSRDSIKLIEVDTTNAVTPIILSAVVGNGFAIIKDRYGNASGHNISLIGVVDGEIDPVINTNFGLARIYASGSNFLSW